MQIQLLTIIEVKNSSLCIFDRTAVQTYFIRNQTVDNYTLTNVASGGSIEFTIPGSSEEYIDVNDIILYILAKVTKADGKNITSADDKVGLKNLPIATLFQDVRNNFMSGIQAIHDRCHFGVDRTIEWTRKRFGPDVSRKFKK